MNTSAWDSMDFGDVDFSAYEKSDENLILDLDGFEGPLHILLLLARSQKVDITQISILALVEQYLSFISEARSLKIEIAADYLVMAAWLIYLKSRLLLPESADDEEPSAQEMATRLQLRLQRLEAMRESGAQLISRNRLGRDVFWRGAPEGIKIFRKSNFTVSYYELLRAYSDIKVRADGGLLTIEKRKVFSLDQALHRLNTMIGSALKWTDLKEFLPEGIKDLDLNKSATASTFAAVLELAREGRAEVKQLEPFGQLYIKASKRADDG